MKFFLGIYGYAVFLKKLGADCFFCAKVGADLHGQKLYQYYRETGIDTSYLKVRVKILYVPSR